MGRVSAGRVLLRAVVVLAVVGAALGAAPAFAEAQSEGAGHFRDDDGSVHEPALDALAARGVLAGIECDEGLICPSEPLKRWEMAVWLVRVLDGADPSPAEDSRFVDVDAEQWWAPFVEQLYVLEVTVGCATDPLRFCPEREVTRAQMATFLTRAFDLELAPAAGFTDVSGGSHAANIDALAAARITVGCSRDPLRYCPANSVTRAQMATFLARALGILEAPADVPASVPFTAVTAGREHSCGLRGDATIACWGDNWQGQSDPPDGEFRAISTGDRHSCGLRGDATISCWGDNHQGQSDAPDGEFQAVSAGGLHSCGLHTDGTVACWGQNEFGQSDAPGDSFRSVSAGFSHTCGVRSDFKIQCWGGRENGQSDPPAGDFSDVRAGGYHTCGVRTDASVTCWGMSFERQADAPGGRFDAVSPGLAHTCGLRADGTAECWGSRGSGAVNAPGGAFTAVSAGAWHSCGLRVDGTIVCWGDTIHDGAEPPEGTLSALSAGRGHNCAVLTSGEAVCWGSNTVGQIEAPRGEFSAVAAGATHSCGLGADKTIACWGDHGLGQVSAPDGEFSSVVAGDWHSCGLRTDDAIVCWGSNGSAEADAPEGLFSQVGLGSWHSCAVRTDGTAVCWGNNSNGQADAPVGEFESVTGGSWHSCGLRTDSTIVCWGAHGLGQLGAPSGLYAAVASGHLHTCAISVDSTIDCWGSNEFGQLDAPDGRFVTIDVGDRHSCAIRVQGAIECWGLVSYLAPPSHVRLVSWMDRADPSSCRPFGVRSGVTAGFPLPAWAAPSIGTLRVAVLFMDFPDTPADHSTRDEAQLGLPFVERYLETVSYGRLDVEFEPLHGWLRAEQGHGHYMSAQNMLEHAVDEQAVRLADPDVDFADFDLLMIVMPSSHWSGGNALGELLTDEGYVSTLRVNVLRHEQPTGPTSWGSIAAHELVHTLGLADLYSYDDRHRNRVDAPANREWVDVEIGLMSMRAHFSASSQDTRLAHDWIHPNGSRSTAYRLNLHALEMLAWSRWQLGWLDASQVVCLSEDEATVTLSPVSAPGGGTVMAAVPLSDHEALVMESRRKIGYDAGLDHREPDGATTTFPALPTEGLLVYTVDASRRTGALPLTVAGDHGDGLVDDYPVLNVGQSVTVRGYTITVVADDGDTHTVTIAKAGEG